MALKNLGSRFNFLNKGRFGREKLGNFLRLSSLSKKGGKGGGKFGGGKFRGGKFGILRKRPSR